jgi:hypothetical protein
MAALPMEFYSPPPPPPSPVDDEQQKMCEESGLSDHIAPPPLSLAPPSQRPQLPSLRSVVRVVRAMTALDSFEPSKQLLQKIFPVVLAEPTAVSTVELVDLLWTAGRHGITSAREPAVAALVGVLSANFAANPTWALNIPQMRDVVFAGPVGDWLIASF